MVHVPLDEAFLVPLEVSQKSRCLILRHAENTGDMARRTRLRCHNIGKGQDRKVDLVRLPALLFRDHVRESNILCLLVFQVYYENVD